MNIMKAKGAIGLTALAGWWLLSAIAPASDIKSDSVEVFVSIPPQAYFVERVAGANARLSVLLKPGHSPHTFEPTARQMMQLGKADVFFFGELPFERRIASKIRGAGPSLRMVNICEGLKAGSAVDPHSGGELEHHDEHSQHAHSGSTDLHVWLSPPTIEIQAQNIARTLQNADPANAEEYKLNLERFLKDLREAHIKIQDVLAPYKGRSVYVFHPAFGCFLETYGLRQEAVEVDGKSPTPQQLASLIDRARTEGVKVIFVQPQFDPKSAQAVATAIDGKVVTLDPLARDVLRNLELMAESVAAALGEE